MWLNSDLPLVETIAINMNNCYRCQYYGNCYFVLFDFAGYHNCCYNEVGQQILHEQACVVVAVLRLSSFQLAIRSSVSAFKALQ